MSRERITNRLTELKEIFRTRPPDDKVAWEAERTRAATDAAGSIPMHDIETMMNIGNTREAFINRFKTEQRLQKRLHKQESKGIEEPNHELQTEF